MAQTGWNWVSARKAGCRTTHSCTSDQKEDLAEMWPNKDNDTVLVAIHHLLNALSINRLALISLVSVCMEEHGLHSVCSSAVPCVLSLSGARSAFMCSCHAPRISTFCVKKQTVLSLGLCGAQWPKALCALPYVGHQ